MTDDDNKPLTETFGKIFAINALNRVAGYGAGEVPEGAMGFSSEAELAALSADWPTRMLIDIWNRLPDVTAVSKFTDRKTAVRRIWQAINRPESTSQSIIAEGTNARKTAAKMKRTQTRQAQTKTERIIALLKRPEGATLKAIMAATGWQAHSVRGFLSGQLNKRMGLKVKSFKRDGELVYRVRS